MTPKQKRVFDFIRSTINNTGVCPTYTEIMGALNIKSKAVVSHYLNYLEKEGKIKINRVKARGIEIENEENQKLKELLKECRDELNECSSYTEFNEIGRYKLITKIDEALK